MQCQVLASFPAFILKQTYIPIIYFDLSLQSAKVACDIVHQNMMQSHTLTRDQ